MESIYKILESPYAYLIIFQVIVVTVLFLMLLWLVIERARGRNVLAYAGGPIADHGPKEIVTVVDDSKVSELNEKIALLEADKERSKSAQEENKNLKEKLKYLESKLLEYEILQEEIGALSQLKIENQQLKQELMKRPEGTPSPNLDVADPSKSLPEGADAAPPPVDLNALSEEMANMGNAALAAKESTKSDAQPDGSKPTDQTETSPPEEHASTAEKLQINDAGLNNLLDQIDNLSRGKSI